MRRNTRFAKKNRTRKSPVVAKTLRTDNTAPEPKADMTDLSPDCARCDALCCVLLAFDASAAFVHDKPACAPCRHLAQDNHCRIHADLAAQGFRGCVAFDCHGAGQRITGQVFKGRSWRDDASLMPAMADAFRTLRQIHEAAGLLQQAATLPLSPAQEASRQTLLRDLDLNRDWTEAGLDQAAASPQLRAVPAFFRALRDTVTPPHR